jgi:hypothetical protein
MAKALRTLTLGISFIYDAMLHPPFCGGFGGCITAKSMFSGFAEFGYSLLVGVTQLLHTLISSAL